MATLDCPRPRGQQAPQALIPPHFSRVIVARTLLRPRTGAPRFRRASHRLRSNDTGNRKMPPTDAPSDSIEKIFLKGFHQPAD